MKRALIFVALAGGIAAADACGLAYPIPPNYPEYQPVSLVGEQAIIIWDPAKKEEHFIRQASFDGDAEDFGFIVPTPAKPTVTKSDQKAFEVMYRLNNPPSIGNPGRGLNQGASAGGEGAGTVTVIEEYQVGDYQAAILKATDGKAMGAWLKRNGYSNRPALEEWMEFYTKKGWFFAALKLIRSPGFTTDRTSAVRVSFKTSVPHYPYKMPSDTWPDGHVRPMTLYFISTGDVTAHYAGSSRDWEATSWESRPLGAGKISLAQGAGINEGDIPSGAQYTTFTNSTNKNGYDLDLEFKVHPHPVSIASIPDWLGSLRG